MECTPFNTGWQVRPRVNSFEEGFRDQAEWTSVHLPHDAIIGLERDPAHGPASGFFPGGAFEYRTRLHAPAEWRERSVALRFEGVHRGALVYVNDQLAASRPYGYTEFTVGLDPFLRFGGDNVIHVQTLTGADSRWYTGGGIYREVGLVVTHPIHVPLDGLAVSTADLDDDSAVISVAVELVNDTRHTKTVDVGLELVDAENVVVARSTCPATLPRSSTSTIHHRLLVEDPCRWDLDDPNLYTCRATLTADEQVLDTAATTFGIRQLQLDPVRGLRMNGRPVKLRGTCLHHDNGVLGAATIGRAEHRRVEILKGAGFNAIRSAHQPISRALLEACDRLGVLVMDETFDVWTRGKSDDDYARAFQQFWESDVEAMVRKDRNHPCVALYSTGNEIQDTGTPLGAALGRRIAEKVKALDPTRYTTNSLNAMLTVGPELFEVAAEAEPGAAMPRPTPEQPDERGVNTLLAMWRDSIPTLLRQPIVAERTAETFAAVDVAGYNYMDARYAIDRDLYPNRVIVGSETFPSDIGRSWPLVESLPHVIGEFTWIGWDYLGESGVGRTEYDDRPADERTQQFMGAFPWIITGSGDITITGVRRPISYYREIVYGLRSNPYVAVERPEHSGAAVTHTSPWSWPDVVSSWDWPGHENRLLRVEVYSGADEVELVLNGTTIGRRPAGPSREFFASFHVPYQPGELVAVAYENGGEVGRTLLRSGVGETFLTVDLERDVLIADDSDLAFIEIRLTDAVNTLRVDADRSVSVRVEGPAVLQGLGSADPRPTGTFRDPTRVTHDGQALAVVRPTGPGTVTVTVESDGLQSAVARLEVLSAARTSEPVG